MKDFWQDIRYSFRLLAKAPAFTAVAILTLALGIGANTAIFSVSDQILLQRLPVDDPEELIVLRSPGPRQGRVWSDGDSATSFSYPMYRALAEAGRDVVGLIARFGIPLSASVQGFAERAEGELVSGNYFEVLGLEPAAGRVFNPDDDVKPGGHPLAVLSHGYWIRRFDGDPGVLDETISVNDQTLTVIGVAPAGFSGVQIGRTTDIFIPLSMKAQMTPNWDGVTNWNDYWLAVMGRLDQGVTRPQAESVLTLKYRPLLEEQVNQMRRPMSGDARERFISKPIEARAAAGGRPILQSDAGTPLLLLSGIVGLVLLIACANVANLVVARGVSRQREMALRLALGSSRGRLFRQLMSENLLLALGGAAVGLLFASWTASALLSEVSANLELQGLTSHLNWRILAFSLVATVLTGLIFGLLPALRASRLDLSSSLKDQGAGAGAANAHIRFRKVLATSQIALTMALLVTAGLLAKSFYNLRQSDLGLRPEQVLQFAVAPELNGYTPERTLPLIERLSDSLKSLPGVTFVSGAVVPVLSDSTSSSNVTVEGYDAREAENTDIRTNWVGADFASTLGMTLLAGRDISRRDSPDSPKVAIINETMVERFFEDGQALGRRFAFGTGNAVTPDIEIVGIVRNSKHTSIREDDAPFAYLPLSQLSVLGDLTFYVRTQGDPRTLAATARDAVRRLDPNLPIYNLKTFEAQIALSTSADRLMTVLSGCFGVLAAVLAAIGLSGVMAYNVAQRSREIGIRIALGARPHAVQWLILRDVAVMTAIGVAVGLPAAYLLGRFAQSILFQVNPADFLIFAGALVLVAGFALASGFVPARGAAHLDPVIAIRND